MVSHVRKLFLHREFGTNVHMRLLAQCMGYTVCAINCGEDYNAYINNAVSVYLPQPVQVGDMDVFAQYNWDDFLALFGVVRSMGQRVAVVFYNGSNHYDTMTRFT